MAFIVAGIYSVLLLVYLQVQEARLHDTLSQYIGANTRGFVACENLANAKPACTFQKYVEDKADKSDLANKAALADLLQHANRTKRHEIVSVSPCNPRIQSCR